jgi:hypothetical protein
MKAIPIDVYDKEGNLTKIEFVDSNGDHVIDAQWDQTEEQTSENRIKFRTWAYDHVSFNLKYEVDR